MPKIHLMKGDRKNETSCDQEAMTVDIVDAKEWRRLHEEGYTTLCIACAARASFDPSYRR